jgi:hypothetical protein
MTNDDEPMRGSDVATTPIGRGTLLAGRFELEDLLGEVDDARFWRATDRILARSVAVHVIPASDPRAVGLLSAARTSATVTDGHLLRVLDAAVEDEAAYVVNEWGSGVSLDRMIAEGPLSARRAAWVVKEVAEAIASSHRHGVAHGRLLPENVMVTEAGSVKLIGFVVDAVLYGGRQVRPGEDTPMSDHEADVVNLAGLLYASLVGRWPGVGRSVLPEAPRSHGATLRPRQVRAGVPRPLDAICDRVLNPGAHGQPPIETAHEIYAALSDYIGDPTAAGQLGQTTIVDEDTRAAGIGEVPGERGISTPGQNGTPFGDRAARPPADPEATQAGAPVFEDHDPATHGWEWLSSSDGPAGEDSAAADRRTPPPPPTFTEPEPRPLFASDAPRHPDPEATAVAPGPSETEDRPPAPPARPGPRNGSLPAAWGPDPAANERGDESEPWAPQGRDQQPGATWLRLAIVIGGVVALVVAVVFAFNLGRGALDEPGATADTSGGSSPRQSAQPSRPLAVAAVDDFDPGGSPPEENSGLAPLAVDGNRSTSWHTVTYFGNPALGGLKDGVGLAVDLGGPRRLASVRLMLGGSPTDLQILTAPGRIAKPTDTPGLRVSGSAKGVGGTTIVRLDKPVTTRWFVVWLTSLPPVSGGFQGSIAEIAPRS